MHLVAPSLVLLLVSALALPARALAEAPVCDPSLAPGTSAWSVRWGTWAADALEPPFHARCDANGAAARLTTATLNASALEWAPAMGGSTVREAEISFLAPSLDDWSHIGVFAAYDSTSIGRVGADVFHETDAAGVAHDRLTVQFNRTADESCAGSNLHAPVPIVGGIAPGHWYRIGARVARRADGGLRVTGTVRDLGAGNALVAATTFDAPPSCTPPWFPDAAGWGIGLLGLRPGVETSLDDFAGFGAAAPPPVVTFTSTFDAALAPWLSVDADPDLSAAIADGALAVGTAIGAGDGDARVVTAFTALGDFTAEVEAHRTALGDRDVLGLRMTAGTDEIAAALLGSDAIAALAGDEPAATVADASVAVTLRLTRTGGTVVAEAETEAGVIPLSTSADAGRGGATIELFLRHVADAAAPAPAPEAGGTFDDLAIAAEQLALAPATSVVLAAYRATWDAGVPRFVRFGPVRLVDVLGIGAYDVWIPRALAVTASLGDTAPEASALLVEYPLATPSGAAPFEARTVRIADTCRESRVQLRRPLSMLVPSTGDLDGTPEFGADAAAALDHLVCYQATARFGVGVVKRTQVDVADGIQRRRYDLGRITKVCNPVDKSGDPVLRTGPRRGTPRPIAAAAARSREPHLVCYTAKAARRRIAQGACGPLTPGDRGAAITPPPPASARHAIAATNQLGAAPMEAFREVEICVPASLVATP